MKRVHDYPTAILMVVSVIASIITIVNAMELSNRIAMSSEGKYPFRVVYTYEIKKEMPETMSFDDFFNHLNEMEQAYVDFTNEATNLQEGNVIWDGLSCFAGNEYDTSPLDIVLNSNEPLSYRLKEGNSFEESPQEIPEVLIGESLLEATYLSDQKRLIDICRIPCKVSGILMNTTSGGNDRRVIMNFETIGEVQKKQIIDSFSAAGLSLNDKNSIVVCGNNEVENSVNMIPEFFGKYSFTIQKKEGYEYNEENSVNLMFVFIKKTILWISILFSASGCICSSFLWSSRKYPEWVVRKVYGYTIFDILRSVLPELGILIIFGCLTGFLFVLVWSFLRGTTDLLFSSSFGFTTLFLGGGIFLIICLILSVPIIKLNRVDLADVIRERNQL